MPMLVAVIERAGEHRRDHLHVEQGHQAGGAQGKGQRHARHRHRGGLGTHRHQLIELALQAGEEQQREQAQGRPRPAGSGSCRRRAPPPRPAGHRPSEPTSCSSAWLTAAWVSGGTIRRRPEAPMMTPASSSPRIVGNCQAHQQLRQQPRRHKDHQKPTDADQGFGHLELMGADLRHRGVWRFGA
jgi:hypothetical protein